MGIRRRRAWGIMVLMGCRVVVIVILFSVYVGTDVGRRIHGGYGGFDCIM